MLHQRATGVAVTAHHVENPGGRTSAISCAINTVEAGVESPGFKTIVLPAAIAGATSHRHHHRVVPWRDRAAHADRLTANVTRHASMYSAAPRPSKRRAAPAKKRIWSIIGGISSLIVSEMISRSSASRRRALRRALRGCRRSVGGPDCAGTASSASNFGRPRSPLAMRHRRPRRWTRASRRRAHRSRVDQLDVLFALGSDGLAPTKLSKRRIFSSQSRAPSRCSPEPLCQEIA